MKVYRTTDLEKNLCDICKYCIADCPTQVTILGSGKGSDNVVECDAVSLKENPNWVYETDTNKSKK